MIENVIKVRNRKLGNTYDCFPQIVDVNHNGLYSLRYNIGINGYNGWSCIHVIYDNETFNYLYEVIDK